MKKNGYTIFDLLIIIAILAVSAIIVIPSVSNALNAADNKDEMYAQMLNSYLNIAQIYGNNNKDDIKKNNYKIVSVDDLIKEGYIVTSTEDIIDIRDNTTKMNTIKFKLTYNEEEDKVYAEVN